ncbi:MAG: hypothetical protein K0Q94_6214, partial [Paenibacillus sp.]|nr:hypothetical protein [Paenibacillus sp.]
TDYINWLGFITIPFLALIAFSLITVILWIGKERAPHFAEEAETATGL